MLAKVSIIMPVYNGEQYIDEAIQSVVAQSHENWELIVVNDGSTDGTKTLLDDWASRDQRIRPFHRLNSGVSASRNFGLEQVKGNLVYFMDADDCLHPSLLELAVDAIDKSNAEIAVFRYDTFAAKGKPVNQQPIRTFHTISGGQAGFDTLESHGLGTSPWLRIFVPNILRHDEAGDIMFDEALTYGEDMFVSWKLCLNCHTITLIDAPLYHYRMVSSSASRKYHKDLYEAYSRAFDDIVGFCYKKRLPAK